MNNESFNLLSSNLEAMLYESMVKIGYLKGQAVGIYYAETLMHHLIGTSDGEVEKSLEILSRFSNQMQEVWGKIDSSYSKGRYKLTVSPMGAEYVFQRNKDNHFLEDLIHELRKQSVVIDDIVGIFRRYSTDVLCRKWDNSEFEYSVEFVDKSIDQFIYCFTFDEMGQYYHRFTEFDFHTLH